MTEAKCSCEKFERLEGASVPAYIKTFLEPVGGSTSQEKNLYRCLTCGREWEKQSPQNAGEGVRPSLVRKS